MFSHMTYADVAFRPGQIVNFGGASAVVADADYRNGEARFLVESGPVRLPMWVPASVLAKHQSAGDKPLFTPKVPDVVAVDNFFDDPDEIRAIALSQEYVGNLSRYKGLRSTQRFLWPNMVEELERLIGTKVRNWVNLDMNGVFQQTSVLDPLVWHHDSQSYAAAVYLTPDAPPQSGTSFWRDRTHGCRRRPDHPIERARLGSDEAVAAAQADVYSEYNVLNGDNWELMESVAGLYNRLVIWDSSLFHSATTYDHFNTDDGTAPTRLVQLFFFDI